MSWKRRERGKEGGGGGRSEKRRGNKWKGEEKSDPERNSFSLTQTQKKSAASSTDQGGETDSSLSLSLSSKLATMRSKLLLQATTSSLSALPSSSSSQRGQPSPSPSTCQSPPALPLRRLSRSRRSSLAVLPSAALPPDAVSSLADLAAHASVLAYERVVLPCQNMGCGDAVYRR